MVLYTRLHLKGARRTNSTNLKDFKKIKNFLKNFKKSVDKSFKICYLILVPARKQVCEQCSLRTIYILIVLGKNRV